MAIDGSAFNSDDLRATSVACHGCRTMGSSDAPMSSHKSSTSRSFSAIGRLLSAFRSMLIWGSGGTLRYLECNTARRHGNCIGRFSLAKAACLSEQLNRRAASLRSDQRLKKCSDRRAITQVVRCSIAAKGMRRDSYHRPLLSIWDRSTYLHPNGPQNDCGGLFTGIGCGCCWR
jgi:hypothetical protein